MTVENDSYWLCKRVADVERMLRGVVARIVALERALADAGGTRQVPLEASDQATDHINHPKHYGGDTPYEAIKVIEAWGLGFALGNAVKYISRAGKKDHAKEIEDLEKARWYLGRRIEELRQRHGEDA